jgi:two-component system chemotaxis sensor kinase CheA
MNMLKLADIPEPVRVDAYPRARDGDPMHWITYTPADECFFKGDDPLFTTRHTPHVLWGRITPREPWPCLGELDTYRCVLQFQMLTATAHEELVECYRHVADQVCITEVKPWFVVIPQGDPGGGPVHEDFIARALHHLEAGDLAALRQAGQSLLHSSHPESWISSALRWLLLLLDSVADQRVVLRSLIASLRTLTQPNWATVNA